MCSVPYRCVILTLQTSLAFPRGAAGAAQAGRTGGAVAR